MTKKLFTTAKFEKKLRYLRSFSVVLAAFAIVLALFKDFSDFNGLRDVGRLLDSFIFFGLAIYSYITTSKQLTLISGSYIEFEEHSFSFKSRMCERSFKVKPEIKNIDIKLKTIEIDNLKDEHFTFFLDDYTEYSDKKEIKAHFEKLAKEVRN